MPPDDAPYNGDDSEDSILGKDPEELVLCYLSCSQDAAKAYLGAMLVTDARARPLDFSYVDPIKPTTMQRILFGKTLDEHIRVDVIAKKLIGGSSRIPDIILVDSPDLLPVRRIADITVALLPQEAEPIEPLTIPFAGPGGLPGHSDQHSIVCHFERRTGQWCGRTRAPTLGTKTEAVLSLADKRHTGAARCRPALRLGIGHNGDKPSLATRLVNAPPRDTPFHAQPVHTQGWAQL